MLKGAVNSGAENVITFTLKKPQKDPLLSGLDCLQDIGSWVTTRAELKISGGYITPLSTDVITVEIFLKAFIEQI